jgi:hypothetical protein
MTIFAVKRRVLEKLYADRKWRKRAVACKTLAELQQVVIEFAKAKGFRIKYLDETSPLNNEQVNQEAVS